MNTPKKPVSAVVPPKPEKKKLTAGKMTAKKMPKKAPAVPEIFQDVDLDGTTEEIGQGITTALQQAFRDGRAQQKASYKAITDSEYWYCLCFQSREQGSAFIKALNWGDPDRKYIDGCALAAALGIELPSAPDGLVFTQERSDKALNSIAETL